MRVWQWDDFGDPSGLALHEKPVPEPGPGEVLIRMRATALNYRDLVVMRNAYPTHRCPPGYVPLCDGAGEVVGTGPGCDYFQVGDRVSPIPIRQWLQGTRYPRRVDLPGSVDGLLADYVVLPESVLVAVPPHLDWAEAAGLPCAGVTAWTALFRDVRWIPGLTVVVQGTGGVSLFALQFAKMAGARVIATSSSDDKLAKLADLGADVRINYVTNPDWDQEVLEATGSSGADLVLDVGGAGTLERSLRCTRPDGQVSVLGMLSEAGGQAAGVDFSPVLQKRIRMQAVHVGSREDMEEMCRAITINAMHPVLDRTFGFADAPKAFEHLRAGRHVGKIVIQHD